ncbi:MAG: phospholipase D-like domain-containing protein [Burkholderiaceae bacterium]
MRWVLGLILAGSAMLSTGCASLAPPQDRAPTHALEATDDTRLGRALAARVDQRAGTTGVHALPQPRDAFATRALLAAAADRSIDVQYYIWHDDEVGNLLFEALWDAAERGVRVRMLLDDVNTKGLDPTIAALDGHPNIEVRLYNPLVQREVRALNFIGDFARVNRRMHNKSFTVDNQLTVVGGRNIGNEYFAAGSGMLFADLDVVAVGAVVPAVSKQFDHYWNSPSAYPARQFVGAGDAEQLKGKLAGNRSRPDAVAYIEAVRATPIVRDIFAGRLTFDWTTAQVVSDDPAKTLDTTARTDILLFPALVKAIGRPGRTLDLITPYFVPGEGGTAALVDLAKSGVAVRILTNSLSASDVSAVHSGYAKRREALLRGGVKLYELKPTAGREAPDSATNIGSSASSGLHAKTFAVDRERVFVGSFNFDQRSALLNTELGLVIDSSALAQRLADGLDRQLPLVAYEVRIGPDDKRLQWIEDTPSGERRHDVEPGTGWWDRFKVNVLSVLPIEWLL